jgi:hypothetical protein
MNEKTREMNFMVRPGATGSGKSFPLSSTSQAVRKYNSLTFIVYRRLRLLRDTDAGLRRHILEGRHERSRLHYQPILSWPQTRENMDFLYLSDDSALRPPALG